MAPKCSERHMEFKSVVPSCPCNEAARWRDGMSLRRWEDQYLPRSSLQVARVQHGKEPHVLRYVVGGRQKVIASFVYLPYRRVTHPAMVGRDHTDGRRLHEIQMRFG